MVKVWEEASSAAGGSRQGSRSGPGSVARRKYDVRGMASDGMQQLCAPSSIDYLDHGLLVGTTIGMILTINLKHGRDETPAEFIKCLVMSHTLACRSGCPCSQIIRKSPPYPRAVYALLRPWRSQRSLLRPWRSQRPLLQASLGTQHQRTMATLGCAWHAASC